MMQLINHSKIVIEYSTADDTTLGSTYVKTEDGRIWKKSFFDTNNNSTLGGGLNGYKKGNYIYW